MPTVADCLRQHAPAYLKTFGESVPVGHRKVISAITRCRTGELGGVHYQCDGCGHEHWVGRSCGNRHCPTCQADKTAAWLDKQAKRLLPVHHFLVTFTVPKELRFTLRGNQRIGYNALFQSASDSLRGMARHSKYLADSELGFFGVLHTWGRDPSVYHPHVHFVVPGGGVDRHGQKWVSTPENFLFKHSALIRIYKAKFADAMRKAGIYDEVPPQAWYGKWVVDIQPVGDGRAALKYLAPYVFRVAISDNRIVTCDEQTVRIRYTPSGKRQSKTRNVDGAEFVRGFLQHVLPRGFQKVRYYGWMSPNSKIKTELVRWLVWLFLGWTFWLASGHAPPEPIAEAIQRRCIKCGQPMRIVEVTDQPSHTLPEHQLAYLDSG